MEFVEEMQLDRMGAFKYSREEGTPADLLPNHVDEDTKKERLERLMMLQQGISEERNQENLGKTLKVLIEDRVDETLFIGRSQKDAEDIDSVVYVETSEDLQIGEMVDVTVEIAYEYDLKGKLAQ